MESGDKVLPLPTPVEITGIADGDGSDDEINSSPVSSLERRHAHTHTMSTRRVCWHRNTSISMIEHSLSVRVSVTTVYVGSLFHSILFIYGLVAMACTLS